MNPKARSQFITAVAAAAAWWPINATASPVAVSGHFIDDARGDAVAVQSLSGELGDDAQFPIGGAIDYHTHRLYQDIGVPNDGIANDWNVHMTNVSGQSWANLFFVADLGATVGNADGKVEDVANAASVFTDAFRIDALGSNANLLSESISSDGIFEPGEEWEFGVMNFGSGLNALPPSFITPGVFAGSSPMVGLGGTNASILASPVPEPGVPATIALFASLLLRRHRGRSDPRRAIGRKLLPFRAHADSRSGGAMGVVSVRSRSAVCSASCGRENR
ncbi:MAG: hypothetical protein JWM57_2411 [Phycisphaerales bacterium]|nr:hypothetical protein [Phycisphaerales bacterium]